MDEKGERDEQVPSGEQGAGAAAHHRRTWLVAVVGGLAVLVVVAALWGAVADRRERGALAEAHTVLAAHLEERAEVIAVAEDARVRGAEAHQVSAGEVEDDTVREHLASVLEVLDDSLSRTRALVTEPDDADISHVHEVVAAVALAVAATALAVSEVELGIESVVDAQRAWVLAAARADVDALVDELTGLVQQGAELVARTDGSVLDESLREQLAAVLDDAAGRLAETVVDDDLAAAAEGLRELLESVSTAVVAVEESNAGWQVERDRAAAGQAAKSGTSRTRPAAQAPVVPQPSIPAQAPAPAPAPAPVPAPVARPEPAPADSGSYWVETETGFGSDLCGDEFGNNWEC